MSSYLTFYLVKKEDLKTFEEKMSKLEDKSIFNTEVGKIYSEMKKIILFDFSRSSILYHTASEEFGFSYNPQELTKDMVQTILNKLKEFLKNSENDLKIYSDKNTINDKETSNKTTDNDNKKKWKSVDSSEIKDLNNLLDIVLEAQSCDNSEYIKDIIRELNETIDEINYDIGIVNALEYILTNNEYYNKEYIVCFDFD